MHIYGEDILYHGNVKAISVSDLPNPHYVIDRDPETAHIATTVTLNNLQNKPFDTLYAHASEISTANMPPHDNANGWSGTWTRIAGQPLRIGFTSSDTTNVPGTSNVITVTTNRDVPANLLKEDVSVRGASVNNIRRMNLSGTPPTTRTLQITLNTRPANLKYGEIVIHVSDSRFIYYGTKPKTRVNSETLNFGRTRIKQLHEVYLLESLYDFNKSTNDDPDDLAGIAQVSWSYLERGGGTLELIDGTHTYYEGLQPALKRSYNVTTDYRSYATIRNLLSLLREHKVFTVIPDFENAPDVIFQATLDREPTIGYTTTITTNGYTLSFSFTEV